MEFHLIYGIHLWNFISMIIPMNFWRYFIFPRWNTKRYESQSSLGTIDKTDNLHTINIEQNVGSFGITIKSNVSHRDPEQHKDREFGWGRNYYWRTQTLKLKHLSSSSTKLEEAGRQLPASGAKSLSQFGYMVELSQWRSFYNHSCFYSQIYVILNSYSGKKVRVKMKGQKHVFSFAFHMLPKYMHTWGCLGNWHEACLTKKQYSMTLPLE
jgi:hypothetical protein